MEHVPQMTVSFRCPPEMASILPRPIRAIEGLPNWLKAMPQRAFSEINQKEVMTIKKCPPVVDAMTYGFLMPLTSDVRIEKGEFFWDHDMPGGGITNFPKSPLAYHDNVQVAGTPFFDDDQFIVKFNNFWAIETPPGYSLLFTHPLNRADLPFTTITGMVDTDRYSENLINFPARWHDMNFNGVLPKGTPVAQCIPVKREVWAAEIRSLTSDEACRLHETATEIANDTGVYRHEFRAPKR